MIKESPSHPGSPKPYDMDPKDSQTASDHDLKARDEEYGFVKVHRSRDVAGDEILESLSPDEDQVHKNIAEVDDRFEQKTLTDRHR